VGFLEGEKLLRFRSLAASGKGKAEKGCGRPEDESKEE
jgi:hypothetical protein